MYPQQHYPQQHYPRPQQHYGYPPQPPVQPPKRKTDVALAVVTAVATFIGAFCLLGYFADGPGDPVDFNQLGQYPNDYVAGLVLRLGVTISLLIAGTFMASRNVGLAWLLCAGNVLAASLILVDPLFFADGNYGLYFDYLDASPKDAEMWLVIGTVLTVLAAICALIAALTPKPAPSHGPPTPPGYPQQDYPPPRPPRQW